MIRSGRIAVLGNSVEWGSMDARVQPVRTGTSPPNHRTNDLPETCCKQTRIFKQVRQLGGQQEKTGEKGLGMFFAPCEHRFHNDAPRGSEAPYQRHDADADQGAGENIRGKVQTEINPRERHNEACVKHREAPDQRRDQP